ncbi:hypothetical protein [Rhodoblastus sp.]|uniref:hypothetical protein n=1 Tax=Rhodoblastus sp. TaxID=1962975 RepID=UPI003F9A5B6B
MILGDILRQFDDPSVVAAALMQFGDLGLLAQAETKAAAYGETLGEYASASVRLFSNEANDDEWVALMAAMGRTDDPGAACLRFMLEWANLREGQPAPCCGSCGGE